MARIAEPADVHYLALEGGGGKGVAYLGAIRALESLKVLPIDINCPGSNQVRGISGASAGAITAMFLAMGCTSNELQAVLGDSSTFTGFFDGPDIGLWKAVNSQNRPGLKTGAHLDMAPLDYIRQKRKSISGLARLAAAIGFLAANGMFGPTNDPIVSRLIAYPEHYLYNLMFDGGMFPGLTVRKFLQSAVYGRLWTRLVRQSVSPSGPVPILAANGSEINFASFFDLTGVDLVITGANITKHKPAVFSRRHTPNFPVAEAVGISMNIPLLFKPVEVEANVSAGEHNERSDDYHGRWCDGGVLNNFPLHAFDFLSPAPASQYPNLRPLHPNILGLRLTDGYPSRKTKRPATTPGTFELLQRHMSDIMGTVLYPSEEGQIRSPDERDQTVDLYTYDLETTDFAPPPDRTETPIAEAERAVLSYFGHP